MVIPVPGAYSSLKRPGNYRPLGGAQASLGEVNITLLSLWPSRRAKLGTNWTDALTLVVDRPAGNDTPRPFTRREVARTIPPELFRYAGLRAGDGSSYLWRALTPCCGADIGYIGSGVVCEACQNPLATAPCRAVDTPGVFESYSWWKKMAARAAPLEELLSVWLEATSEDVLTPVLHASQITIVAEEMLRGSPHSFTSRLPWARHG